MYKFCLFLNTYGLVQTFIPALSIKLISNPIKFKILRELNIRLQHSVWEYSKWMTAFTWLELIHFDSEKGNLVALHGTPMIFYFREESMISCTEWAQENYWWRRKCRAQDLRWDNMSLSSVSFKKPYHHCMLGVYVNGWTVDRFPAYFHTTNPFTKDTLQAHISAPRTWSTQKP